MIALREIAINDGLQFLVMEFRREPIAAVISSVIACFLGMALRQ